MGDRELGEMPLRYNGEIVELAAGPPVAGVTDEQWEVEGDASAEYRATELDQTSPAGAGKRRGVSAEEHHPSHKNHRARSIYHVPASR